MSGLLDDEIIIEGRTGVLIGSEPFYLLVDFGWGTERVLKPHVREFLKCKRLNDYWDDWEDDNYWADCDFYDEDDWDDWDEF